MWKYTTKRFLHSSLDFSFLSTNRTLQHNVFFTVVNQRPKCDMLSVVTRAVPLTQSDPCIPELPRQNRLCQLFQLLVEFQRLLCVFSLSLLSRILLVFSVSILLPFKTVVKFS